MENSLRSSFSSSKSSLDSCGSSSSSSTSLQQRCHHKVQKQQDNCRSVEELKKGGGGGGLGSGSQSILGDSNRDVHEDEVNSSSSPVHKMLEVQSLYKPAPSHQPTAKRRRLRLTSVPLVDLRAPQDESSLDGVDLYGSLNSPPRSLLFDADSGSLSNKSGVCSMSESMDSQRLGSSRIRHMNSSWETESRFPKLNECAHFHYEFVELGPISVCLYEETQENTKSLSNGGDVDHSDMFSVQVSSNGKSWVVRRSYDNFHMLDRQLHQCVYDRKFSALPEIVKDERRAKEEDDADSEHSSIKRTVSATFSEYLQRFSDIAGNLISCGPILNWLELDNRGNRLIVTDDSAINTPAVAAAYVTKRYIAQANDEISFEVGDMISVIDMPPSDESIWWRGKRGFEVGFFPSDCVEVIGDKVPHTIHIPKAPTKPVLRKHGKLIAFFRSFILSRPSRRKLKQSGILKERVFGCDLGEHLLNSGHEIPMVLKCCADFIEGHGIVDGIYRLSGVTSNIQKLRNTFDEDRVPDLNDEAILQDIHSVASLLKMYFRELPNPLLTYQLYDKFVLAVQSEEEDRLLNIRDVVQQMPPPHYRTLEYLVKHLARVAAHGAETGMTPKNVAIVWAPNLLRSKDLEFGGVAALQVVGVQAVVTEFLIHYSDLIFNDKMPVFPPVLGAIGGTPKRNRPKSLAISTPTKLLSLEEARSRALGAGTQSYQKYIEVGGGPATLPTKYHTVIDFPDGKRGSIKNKKSPSGWKMFFTKGRSSSQSSRDREKPRRKSSTTPSDPGSSVAIGDKAVTEADVTRNSSRLRSVKSAESLVSSSATSSHRNSEALDATTFVITQSVNCGQSRILENFDDDDNGDLMSSSLGAVPLSQKQSPHSHIRSVSHDSYFEFTLDRRRDERLPGELSTILSEENDDDSESNRLVLDDFGDVAADMSYMKICYADQEKDFKLIGCMDEITPSLTNDEENNRVTDFDRETTATNDLNNRLSFDFDDGLRDIVGDIQQEVAAALHWDKDTLTSSSNTCAAVRPSEKSTSVRDCIEETSEEDRSLCGKVIVERYGSEQTVVIEVHATEDNSREEDTNNHRQSVEKYSDQDEAIQIHSLMSPVCSLLPIDSLEVADAVLVSSKAETEVEQSFSDSLECPHEPCRLDSVVCENVEAVSDGLACDTSETFISHKLNTDNDDHVTSNMEETVPRIFVQEPSLTMNNDELQLDLCLKRQTTDESSTTLVLLETTSPGDCTESDSSLASHVPSVNGNLSSNVSPSDELVDLFSYSVLTNEEELTPVTPLENVSLIDTCIPTVEKVNLDVTVATIKDDGVPVRNTQDFNDPKHESYVPQSPLPSIQVEELESDTVEDTPYTLLNSCSESPSPNMFSSSPRSPLISSMSSSTVVSPVTPTSPCGGFDGIGATQLRRPSTLPEKLSPVEESKRKFESEIGRDILRERKLKLEMEKIQLEQQQQKVVAVEKQSPQSTPSSTTVSEINPAVGWNFEVTGGIDSEVELRRPKSAHLQSSDEPKRSSEPILSPSTPMDTKVASDDLSGESNRHSEPVTHNRKGMRPERKASVRELMSKFEGSTPKVQLRDSNTKSSVSSEASVTGEKNKGSVSPLIQTDVKPEDRFGLVQDSSPELAKEEVLDNTEVSKTDVVYNNVTSPVDELEITKGLESPTIDTKCGASDPARRERINRYKEERRAQLREKIKSESFRGEQDGQSEYLLRLKQKAASPTKQLDDAEDLIGFPPTSPRRRSRLSCTSIGSPVEDKCDVGFVTRRRSHVPRITEITSPNGSVESSPTASPHKSAKDKGCGLPIPPPSPRKVLSLVENNTTKDSSQTGRPTSQTGLPPSNYGSNRPKDLLLDRKDVNASSFARKTPSPRKEIDVIHKLRSPVKDRFATQGKSKEEEQNDCGTQSVGKNRGPPLPPRKIKDVAALFEQDLHGSDKQLSKPCSQSQTNAISGSQTALLKRQTSQDGKKSPMQTSATPSWKAKYSSGP